MITAVESVTTKVVFSACGTNAVTLSCFNVLGTVTATVEDDVPVVGKEVLVEVCEVLDPADELTKGVVDGGSINPDKILGLSGDLYVTGLLQDTCISCDAERGEMETLI